MSNEKIAEFIFTIIIIITVLVIARKARIL